ncbi:MAG: hypothetical protein KDJ47_07200 [Hyphomicrobiaceae bacterium]|nr:hypothetical protein [Hyphomicrobiaceae bacterium]
MSPEAIGIAAGGAFGLVNMGILRAVAARMEASAKSNEQKRTVSILRLVAFLDVIIFAVLGYFLVPMFME